MKSSKKPENLLIVAHPDDEAIFFSGLLLASRNWHVICVTDGNADGLGLERQFQFRQSCKHLKVLKADCWEFPDVFKNRLDVALLEGHLKGLPKYKRVFTHGILGEYEHKHHQDVSYATHRAFYKRAPVFSVAYNVYPDFNVRLTEKQFKIKTDILWKIYAGETKRFLNFLPATSTESFSKLSIKEVEAIYSWLTQKIPIPEKALLKYKWLLPYLQTGGGNLDSRVF